MRAGWLFWVGALAMGCSEPRKLAFEKVKLDPEFRTEGVAVFDVDHDGHADIVTDQFWYAGPSMTPHEIRTPEAYDPMTQYSHGFAIYGWDVDHDGWEDLVVVQFPTTEMLWYRNPSGADVHWDRFTLEPGGVAGLETPIVVELFGPGRPILLMTDVSTGTLGWYEPGDDPTQPWPINPISGPGYAGAGPFVHGIGVGDIDGDGRLDALTGFGWFQQTADPYTWIQHDFPFGPNHCSQIHATDVDQDGLTDVFCSRPHDYGLYWWHQDPAVDGERTFTQNEIDTTTSQMHAMEMVDLDGDGVPELITGKRFWAHGPMGDPGVNDPAVLSIYKLRRTAGAITFDRLDLDQDTGIGTSFAVADVDGDHWKDIIISNKKGMSWFRSR